MGDWECGVCSYLHKENERPEKCPVCDAPAVMFARQGEAIQDNESSEIVQAVEEKIAPEPFEQLAEGEEQPPERSDPKRWCCKVCGYIHTGEQPPEKCPVCDAPAVMFEKVDPGEETSETAQDGQLTSADRVQDKETAEVVQAVEEKLAPEPFEELTESKGQTPVRSGPRRWRCKVCGYIHTGDQPPEKCPVCDAPAVMFEEVDPGEEISEEALAAQLTPAAGGDGTEAEDRSASFLDKIGDLVLNFHLHPITVHFPNGILPAAVVFLALSAYFKLSVLETAAFFNFIFVLIMLPMVLFTGYLEWQKRFQGIRTSIFIIKIVCGLIVLVCTSTLVFWRLLDPLVAADGSPTQLIYLGIAGLALAAAGIAGHLGGKLVFGVRG